MDIPLELSETGRRLAKTDILLMALLKQRMDLALEVEKAKNAGGSEEDKKIFHAEREDERLEAVREWATENGMNPNFAHSILYAAINESCKQQMIQLQNRPQSENDGDKLSAEEQWDKLLKKNLLTLTQHESSSYDEDYKKAPFATRAYLNFEKGILEEEIKKLPNMESVLDIGCATGRLTFELGWKFKRAIGYDISPDMIKAANAKSSKFNVRFQVVDVQDGIPEPDNSISLVIMNLGTASDVKEIEKVLGEIRRVLSPNGRFLLSFYNVEALLYAWDFIPWPIALAAKINIHKHCLEVFLKKELLSVYAKPYSVEGVSELIGRELSVTKVRTYPTVSAVLPKDFFENQPNTQKSIITMDTELATSNSGAYIIVTGEKTS